jgi:hypothetical protein
MKDRWQDDERKTPIFSRRKLAKIAENCDYHNIDPRWVQEVDWDEAGVDVINWSFSQKLNFTKNGSSLSAKFSVENTYWKIIASAPGWKGVDKTMKEKSSCMLKKKTAQAWAKTGS